MKKIIFITGFVLVSMFFSDYAVARHEVSLPKAGITPLTPFYFVDQLGEKIRLIFTFNHEEKIKILHEQALERISEVQEMLVKKGVEAPGIQIALANLNKNSMEIKGLSEKIKQKGENVSDRIKVINSNFHEEKKAAKAVFENAKEDFLSQKDLFIESFKEAVEEKNFELAGDIKKQLDDIELQKNTIELIKDSAILKLEAVKEFMVSQLEDDEKLKDETEMKFEKLEEEAEEIMEQNKEKERDEKIKNIENELKMKKNAEALERGGKFLEDLEKETEQIESELDEIIDIEEETDKRTQLEQENLDLTAEKESSQ